LVRVGDVSAAAFAALTIVITLGAWMLHGAEPADAAARASAPGLSVFGTIHPPLLNYGNDGPQDDLPRARLASLESGDDPAAAARATDASSHATSAIFFDARFSAGGAPSRSSLSFEERFARATNASAPLPADTASVADPPAPKAAAETPRVAATVPAPRNGRRSVAAQGDAKQPPAQYRLASLGDTSVTTAYAPVDAAVDSNPLAGDLSHTAIYDISAHTVYLPSGERLEAHSGLGGYMDDTRSVHLKSRGPTPPNVYELSLRESLFHVVQAIRLTPVDGSKMYGRDGILAHPFMLGPEGQSNGCVSLKDYPAFLKAYRRGEITRIVVVEQLDGAPNSHTAADWFADKLKKIFGPS